MSYLLTSPPGSPLIVDIQLSAGKLYYAVLRNGRPVIASSSLGQIRSDQDFYNGLQDLKCHPQPDLKGSYTLLQGKQRDVTYLYTSWQCRIQSNTSNWFSIEFALSDTAVAFRYHHEPQDYLVDQSTELLQDATTFWVVKTENDLQLAQPYDVKKSQYQTFYQPRDDRKQARIGSQTYAKKSPDGYGLPAMFKTAIDGNVAWMVIKEAGFDGTSPASHIAEISQDGLVSLAFPADTNGNGAFGPGNPALTLPWTSPWRIVTVGGTPDNLVRDTSVTDLSQPSKIKDTSWIQLGSTSWSWYAEPTNPLNYTAAKAYIDLAADLGWPYSLLDATWDQQVDENGRRVSLEETSKYARSKGVRLWVWMNTAGPNNDAYDVTPRDLLFDPATRRKTMQWLVDLDVAGIKVDGIESEKQGMMQYLLDILADAAEFKLMIVFHNCPVPHGWERTWPNLISSEGLVTSEYYTNTKTAYAPQMPENNVNEAFVRLTVGPADYAPGTFSQDVYPFDAPLTTFAHEVALHVLMDSGLRCFPESPETYQQEIDPSITAFLSEIPFVWDETHFLAGEPGKYFVIAKRSGQKVYVAGINGETVRIAKAKTDRSAQGVQRQLALNVTHLSASATRHASVTDILNSRYAQIDSKVFNGTHLNVEMEPFGGFVVVLSTQNIKPRPVAAGVVDVVSDWTWIKMFLIVLPVLSLSMLYARWYQGRSLSRKRTS